MPLAELEFLYPLSQLSMDFAPLHVDNWWPVLSIYIVALL